MKSRGPILLGFLYLVFFFSLLLTANKLPDLVASHFNGRGHPDDWMDRSNYLLFTVGLALFLPALVVGLCYGLRFAPDSTINLPRRDYWLAPERRLNTDDYFFRQSLWFACMAVAFVIGIHFTIFKANTEFPVRLSTPLLLAFAGSFLVGVVAWSLHLIGHFFRKQPKPKAESRA